MESPAAVARSIGVPGVPLVRVLAAVIVAACGADRGGDDGGPVVTALDDRAAASGLADGFDFPVGAPDADGYYDAQPFGTNLHLGEDWNGLGGGDTDLGDPVRTIAAGRVTLVADLGGGWGNVVRIAHRFDDGGTVREVESLYAHLERVAVADGGWVVRGQMIGTIGTAGGQYLAHLHLELREVVGLPLGGGYGAPFGQLAPTPFIHAHRPRARPPG